MCGSGQNSNMSSNVQSITSISILLLIVFYNGCQCKRLGLPQKSLTLSDKSVTCSRNSACKYAICDWKREINLHKDDCAFIETSCRCPGKHICALTDRVIPGSLIYAFQYRCKKPKSVLMINKNIDNQQQSNRANKGRRVSFYHRIGK